MSTVQCGLFLLLLQLVSSAPNSVLDQSSCKACAAGAVRVGNGAYYNILVVVENGVSYDPNIVPNIQDYFESASEALFTATKDHSGRYFGEVTILVPEYWPEIDTIPATTEAANKATFSVRPDTPEWGSNPYTIRVVSECGAPGQVTVLPESFTNNKAEAEKYGPNVGKTIVHEWAHLRYGLFDESAWEDGGDTFPCGSIQDSGQVPRCSAAIEGTAAQAEESGMCVFVPDVNNQTAAASLLYAPYLASVEHFCDDDGLVQDSGLIHNAFALNEQNTRCQLRSAWSVMRDHPDFASGVEGATTLEPVKFRVVRDNTLRISIVMDVSGSMNTYDRITWMHQSVENFLQSLLKASTTNEVPIMVGLSKFSTQAQQIHELVLINDTTIDSLVSGIPSVTEGSTSIGAGIRKGLEVLGTPGLRSMVVVFTDGEENTAPYIVDVEEEVCEFNATVYGMIVSNVANNHPLIRLSEATCGGSCIVEDTSQTTIYDCLWSAMKERVPQLAPLQLVADVVNVPKKTNLTDSVMVDSAFTNDVVFRFEWPARVATGGKCELLEVEIVTPGGVIMLSADYNPTATRIEIPGSSNTVGEWFYTVSNPSSTDCDVRVTIEGDTNNMTYADQPAQISVATSKSNLALNASASVQSNSVAIYVTVTKGTTPVIGADVTAIVTLGSTNWIVDLLDNGASADVKKNDGIYSRYFINYNANGAYSIRVEVLGLNGKVKLNKQSRSYAQPAPPLPQYRVLGVTSTNVPTEAFQRSAVGGLIEISGYDPLTTSAAALYPPSQIADLVTALADTSSSSVTIMWTAVGAYLDQGNVSSYDIRLSLDPTELIKSFDSAFQLTSDMVVNGSSLTLPLAAGLAEQMMLNLNNTNFTSPDVKVFIAIVAINAAGRRSPVSNLGQFYFVPVAMPEEPEPVPTTPNDPFPGWAIALIVIGCAMFIVLVVIATVLVYKKTHQKVKYTGNENTYVNGPGVYMSPPAYEGPQSSRINDEKV